MRLRPFQLCPLHRRIDCCGRSKQDAIKPKEGGKWEKVSPGVRRHRDTGLERRSPAAMRQLTIRKVKEQNGICGICHRPMLDMQEVVPDHIEPRGLGGAFRDDSSKNIQAAHSLCNQEKGSKRL